MRLPIRTRVLAFVSIGITSALVGSGGADTSCAIAAPSGTSITFPEELVAKDAPGRNAPLKPIPYSDGDLDKTSLSGERGIASFKCGFSGGGGCQCTMVSEDTFVSAAHCLGPQGKDVKGPLELEVNALQFGDDPKMRTTVKATAYVSPDYRYDDFTDIHDFVIVKIKKESVNASKRMKEAVRVPLCPASAIKPNLKVKVPSHRTGRLYDAFIDVHDETNHNYAWKGIGKRGRNIPVQLVTRDGGPIGGDSGGGLVLPTGCLGGVFIRLFGAGGSTGGQYLAYSVANDWARDTIAKISGTAEKPAAASVALRPHARRQAPLVRVRRGVRHAR